MLCADDDARIRLALQLVRDPLRQDFRLPRLGVYPCYARGALDPKIRIGFVESIERRTDGDKETQAFLVVGRKERIDGIEQPPRMLSCGVRRIPTEIRRLYELGECDRMGKIEPQGMLPLL